MSAGPEQIAKAVRRLHAGEPVIVPTDTLYGLACDATSEAAVRRVFALKHRPPDQPVSVLVSSEAMAKSVAADWTAAAGALADRFWPGALTLVLARAECVPDAVTAGGPTIGIRMPNHPITLALIEALGRPIVGTSANRSGEPAPATPEDARAAFDEEIYLLDAGECSCGQASTVVDVTSGQLVVLRQGSAKI